MLGSNHHILWIVQEQLHRAFVSFNCVCLLLNFVYGGKPCVGIPDAIFALMHFSHEEFAAWFKLLPKLVDEWNALPRPDFDSAGS